MRDSRAKTRAIHRRPKGGGLARKTVGLKVWRVKKKPKEVANVPCKGTKGWRLWLFRAIAVTVVPALFVLSLEMLLRIAGYGYTPTATVKCRLNAVEAYGDNVKFGWRFFPRNISQEFDPFIFPAAKQADTYRILILGGSAAQGTPDAAFGFGRILQAMLRNSYPRANFEVVVAAMPAVNSHVLLEVAKDAARHDPDLFVAYFGNNEVVGPYGAGTVLAPLSARLSLIRASIALRTTRLGQLVTDISGVLRAKRDAPEVWRGMEMFVKQQVRADDPRLETVYRHFQKNLEDICHVAGRSGAKLILCTVGSSLRSCPPFGSLHSPKLTETQKKKWDSIYQQGVEHESTGNYAEAIECYLSAGEIDDSYADLQFRLGRCYWAMGGYDRAKESYIKARDLDTLRFRADMRINQIIRAVGSTPTEQGVYITDVAGVLEENSPGGTAGEELFHEHVHLNFHGNYLLARTVFEQVQSILPARFRPLEASEQPVLTEAQCAHQLAYNDWARYNTAYKVLNYYLKKPPFTGQLYHDEQVKKLERQLQVLEARLTREVLTDIASQYNQLLAERPNDVWLHWRYAELLSVRLQNENAAAEHCRLTLGLLPHSYKPHLFLALSLGRLGRLDEAIYHLHKVTQIKPTSGDAYHCLGLAYQAQGQTDKAIDCYLNAVRLQPNNTEACNNLAQLFGQQRKFRQAAKAYRRGLLSAPNDIDLRYNLGMLLQKQGRKEEAIGELRTALSIDPNSPKIRTLLRDLLEKQNPPRQETRR